MHLFFTGAKRVGKSTLLNSIVTAVSGQVGGFRTVRLNTFLPGIYTVHMVSPNGAHEPSEENLLFCCGEKTPDMLSRFDRLGCLALSGTEGADLVIMDELGPHETEAAAFRRAVWKVLEGDTPVLGVLQKGESPFLEQIARHPKVHLLSVTEENRNDLAEQIPELIKILMKG